jgi:hypothetical protein
LCTVLNSTLLHLPAPTDSTVSEDAGIEASAVEGREVRAYRVVMSTIWKRKQKRSDIEAYYRNESKTF